MIVHMDKLKNVLKKITEYLSQRQPEKMSQKNTITALLVEQCYPKYFNPNPHFTCVFLHLV